MTKFTCAQKNLHQDKYLFLLDDFEAEVNPAVGYDVIESYHDFIPLEKLTSDSQKLLYSSNCSVKETE